MGSSGRQISGIHLRKWRTYTSLRDVCAKGEAPGPQARGCGLRNGPPLHRGPSDAGEAL